MHACRADPRPFTTTTVIICDGEALANKHTKLIERIANKRRRQNFQFFHAERDPQTHYPTSEEIVDLFRVAKIYRVTSSRGEEKYARDPSRGDRDNYNTIFIIMMEEREGREHAI